MPVIPVPGDVWAVRTPDLGGRVIRLGAALRDLFKGDNPYGDLANHVVTVSHQKDGVWWGIEGRPGGVGWCDLTRYINDPCTTTNYDQPKSDGQRQGIVALMPQVLGTPYDWSAIFAAAADDLHLPELMRTPWPATGIPGHFICSALSDWFYAHTGLANPGPDRDCQPSDWIRFNLGHGWLA